jgi:hypothetical protein
LDPAAGADRGSKSELKRKGPVERMERYEVIRDIGSGNFGVAKLVRDVNTKDLYAVKFIERGYKVGKYPPNHQINQLPLFYSERFGFFFCSSLPAWRRWLSLVFGRSLTSSRAALL